mgnify:CR=1 FL=1
MITSPALPTPVVPATAGITGTTAVPVQPGVTPVLTAVQNNAVEDLKTVEEAKRGMAKTAHKAPQVAVVTAPPEDVAAMHQYEVSALMFHRTLQLAASRDGREDTALAQGELAKGARERAHALVMGVARQI